MNTQTLPFQMSRDIIHVRSTTDTCWEAVLSRDASRDGEFVYAVRSTRVYCRPSCPSRRPRRDQVQFFRAPEAAKAAGYRACLRCHPDDPESAVKNSAQERIVARICEAIEQPDEGVPNLENLASNAGISPHALLRVFRKKMGITPRQYADAVRLRKLKSGLQKGADVTTAMYDAGYGSSSRLYEQADAQLGMTPSTYRHGGRGMHISYTIENCALGKVLVGATERGISAVYLGDRDRALQQELRKEYPHADLKRDDSSLREWVRPIVANIGGANHPLDLPIDVQATAFQRRVWEELRRIPRGATRSYGDIAAAIGRPRATRAVASACAANRVAIVVPCHRVVRREGTISGYRWGAQRKRALLEQEKRSGAFVAARISAD
ncbi:MAG TPA: bifunctional DNA-binding transcriptional regulator/O6-methylguanine-DNA methyltransferase Ada [Candidatus Acidoferrales bacterium]|nr:bifunctional DNA-binding transcriptional regulator/O6-methylguanine-DNA methyltransferase Ada [Candidatus Acidoferrales bacterium]